GPVADREPRPRARRSDRAPFLTGREACPTSATQAALGDLVDDGLRGGTQSNLEPSAATGIDVLGEGGDGLPEECHARQRTIERASSHSLQRTAQAVGTRAHVLRLLNP